MSSEGKWEPGPPTFAVVPPGQCQLTDTFTELTLLQKTSISKDTIVFKFATPDKSKALNLSTCACILAMFKDEASGEEVIRPYTPCSTNAMTGAFELMVKVYPKGKMTTHMKGMTPGTSKLFFKHIKFNVKLQYPFKKKFIGMIVGGTGITPMIQALHAILGNKKDKTEVGILYGTRTSDNILANDTLFQWTQQSKRLSVAHVLSDEPDGSDWKGLRGFITKDMVKNFFPTPSSDVMIFICGPPPLYDIFCGPRDEEKVTGVLEELGFDQSNVFKF